MNRAVLTMAAAGLGAAATYLLDPDTGRLRRALVRDQLVHLARVGRDAVDVTSRDMRNRAQGLAAELRGKVGGQAPPGDEILIGRVRSQLGYAVRHPGAIEVTARDGRVMLSGPVLADEVDRLLRRVRRVRGVTDLDNRLDVHDSPDRVPGLQGEPSPRWEAWEFEWMQRNWSPAARLVAAVVGAALLVAGLGQRGALGATVSIPGGLLFLRALANRELARLPNVRSLRTV